MTRGGGSGIVEGVRSRSGIAMANRCAGDGGTALVIGEKGSLDAAFPSFPFFFSFLFGGGFFLGGGSGEVVP